MVWLGTTLFCLALCTLLPISIKDPDLRRKVSWFILIPVSLILIVYAYPVGVEVFSRWAVH